MNLFNSVKDTTATNNQAIVDQKIPSEFNGATNMFGNKKVETPTQVIEQPVIKKSMFGNKKVEEPVITPTTYLSHPESGLVDVLNLRGIRQVYKGADKDTILFDNFDFNIEDIPGEGQFVSLLGKSGCGKSTILRYISGLQKPTDGHIYMYGKELTDNDYIPMVFQAYSSFHWKSVIENVALPLLIHGVHKDEAFARAEKIIKLVGLQGQENKWAKAPLLSGGQLQRVAIARSIVANPKILLLDEPFSGLDIINRTSLQNILLDLFYNPEVDVTFVLVTHDIREAVYLSNRLYIMKANPGEIYKEFKIDFGQQRRTRDTKYLPEFVNLTREIEDVYNNLG
jgi:NitT/TauT family transport system ATP-binding protein